MYSMGVLMDTSLDGRLDGHKPGMYSLGVLVVVVDGHKSGPGRKKQHVWVHAYLPCLQRMPTQKLWITPGCIQAERS